MISLVNIWNMLWRAKKCNIQNGCHAWHPMLLPTRRLPDQAIIRLILWGLNSTLVTSCWHIWDEISLCANWQVMPKTDRVTLLQSGTKIFLVNLGRETKWTTSSKKGQISLAAVTAKCFLWGLTSLSQHLGGIATITLTRWYKPLAFQPTEMLRSSVTCQELKLIYSLFHSEGIIMKWHIFSVLRDSARKKNSCFEVRNKMLHCYNPTNRSKENLDINHNCCSDL